MKKIGRLLINHLGSFTGKSGISKKGITGIHGIPPEIARYIGSFNMDR